MIPLATAHLTEDPSDDFLGSETSGSRKEIKKTTAANLSINL